ncbi:hypothetical protein [Robbsia andropogonis]|uniref:hypothetical protein n=1 Tax=Robbsia andropogonis TaxID=28092 RepID=UPI0020A1B5DD|nr:hypothetical protein [Robbsia andropogonis]MCP1120123.1 hypothetical protein [Robbsia andropogonis]MCP1130045.1 hypothetical protein [Robbsia andropogonis]
MDWSDVGKMVGGVLFGGVSWGAAARVWRQIDRVRQAKSEGDTEVVRASLAAEVDTIARYEKLAELAEKRAERAELRELAAVERADRAEVRERDADERARRAEAKVEELERRIARLESTIGKRRQGDA